MKEYWDFWGRWGGGVKQNPKSTLFADTNNKTNKAQVSRFYSTLASQRNEGNVRNVATPPPTRILVVLRASFSSSDVPVPLNDVIMDTFCIYTECELLVDNENLKYFKREFVFLIC